MITNLMHDETHSQAVRMICNIHRDAGNFPIGWHNVLEEEIGNYLVG
jgi:hypothetical protein